MATDNAQRTIAGIQTRTVIAVLTALLTAALILFATLLFADHGIDALARLNRQTEGAFALGLCIALALAVAVLAPLLRSRQSRKPR